MATFKMVLLKKLCLYTKFKHQSTYRMPPHTHSLQMLLWWTGIEWEPCQCTWETVEWTRISISALSLSPSTLLLSPCSLFSYSHFVLLHSGALPSFLTLPLFLYLSVYLSFSQSLSFLLALTCSLSIDISLCSSP